MISLHRCNGDLLSIQWSNEGTLSTAFLTVGTRRYDVSFQLPGLKESNYKPYLRCFGFSEDCILCCRVLSELKKHGFTLSSATQDSRKDCIIGTIITEESRSSVCPVPIAIARFSISSGKLLEVLKQIGNTPLSTL